MGSKNNCGTLHNAPKTLQKPPGTNASFCRIPLRMFGDKPKNEAVFACNMLWVKQVRLHNFCPL